MTGYVQVYTGEGKGKTTAATGLALRAAGAGLRVFIGQFIKAKDTHEMVMLRRCGADVTVKQFGEGHFIKGAPSPEEIAGGQRGIDALCDVLRSGAYDVVIADEANGALHAGVIQLADIHKLLDARPKHVELIITGRNAHSELIERADLVTNMQNIKHPFDHGVAAREGIEY